MDKLAGVAMHPLRLDPTGRSFALLDQAERERLGTLLRPLAWLDGLITASVLVPDGDDESEDWLDHIWTEENEDEIGKLTLAQANDFFAPVMNHYYHVTDMLFDQSESYRPYLEGFGDPLEAAARWANGFRVGISLQGERGRRLFANEDSLSLLTVILSLLREEDIPEDLRATSPFRSMPADRLEHMRRTAVEMLPRIVLALHDYGLALDDDLDPDDDVEATGPYVRDAPKVGRNDPCPCGSGSKHKKCCLDK
jgi:uncharacterized protein